MHILIIGGSGGIGLALVKCFLEHFSNSELTATYHTNRPDFRHAKLKWERLDITSEQAIASLATNIPQLDILVNTVGLLHTPSHRPEKTIKEFKADFFEKNIAVNTLPSILLAKHFMTALRSHTPTFFIILSARVGSMTDNNLGGWLSYRVSKTALNMAVKTISIEWQQKLPNCCVLLFHPGTTDTKLSMPFQKGLPEEQLHTPETTATALLGLIQRSGPEDTGRFMSFDGTKIDW